MLPCKVVARNSNVENTRIEIIIPSIFFCPARTAANASQPLPELMFGTKDEIRNVKIIPAMQEKKVAICQDKNL